MLEATPRRRWMRIVAYVAGVADIPAATCKVPEN